jgi:hypothetical protein
MDPADEVAEGGEPRLRLTEPRVEVSLGTLRIRLQCRLRQLQIDHRDDELLLGAVVEIPP